MTVVLQVELGASSPERLLAQVSRLDGVTRVIRAEDTSSVDDAELAASPYQKEDLVADFREALRDLHEIRAGRARGGNAQRLLNELRG